jgi:uncharacterized protein
VDKFQGQKAPIAIYSTATSSQQDAPHGMEFLYSLNRLNVATSRAKCVSIIVGCSQIFEPECRTPRQMQLANAFCRYLEMAKLLTNQ